MSAAVARAKRAFARARAALDRRLIGQRLSRATQPTLPSRGAVHIGFHAAPSGLGQAARLCAAELERAGHLALAYDAAAAARPHLPADAALIFQVNPDVLAQALAPFARAELTPRARIGYWTWELERAPRAWADCAARMHALWAPSRFAADALANTFGRAAEVVPHPVALHAPAAPSQADKAAARARLGLGEDDFVAAFDFSFASSMARKNPIAAITAFRAAFSGVGGRTRRLLVRARDGALFPRAHETLARAIGAAGDVRLLRPAHDDPQEYDDLLAACDVYLSLHRSEGFGLNLAEAMARARPVIATAWSGNVDFMNETCALLVPARLVPVIDADGVYRMRGARWAEPDLDAAIAHLRRLDQTPDFAAEIGARARAAVIENLSGGAAAQALARL